MSVQRDIWKQSFEYWPSLPCPSCKNGRLAVSNKSIVRNETSSSNAARKHFDWEPDWIEERFVATMICSGPTCSDVVSVCGKTTMDFAYSYGKNGETVTDLECFFWPTIFDPAPPLFQIPDECPKEVKEELQKAFALFWSDRGSGANRLRVAVEELMNALKIQRKAKIKKGENKGKFRDLSLHERIEIVEEKHNDAATQLMAIKWLGNAGSHAIMDKLTHAELLDAFEHFDFALDLIYVNQRAVLMKRAKRIIKKKGPIRAKRRRKGKK